MYAPSSFIAPMSYLKTSQAKDPKTVDWNAESAIKQTREAINTFKSRSDSYYRNVMEHAFHPFRSRENLPVRTWA